MGLQARSWLVGVVAALTWGGVSAAEGPWEEYEKLINKASTVAAHGPTLMGDQVSLQSGALSFRVTDISLPGNNALPVELTRTFNTETFNGPQLQGPARDPKVYDEAFSDWDLELPNISGVFAISTGWINPAAGQASKRCELTHPSLARGPTIIQGGASFQPDEVWSGTRISIPGRGSKPLMLRVSSLPQPNAGGAYWITPDWTSVACLPSINSSNGGSGQGFVATTAEGVRYTFDWMAVRHETRLAKVVSTHNWGSSYQYVPRGRFALYATRVEDRFGNWVSYTYTNAATAPVKLTRIESSDGRLITLTHNGNFVASASVTEGPSGQVRTWSYGYAGNQLTTVTLPDARQWSIALNNFKRLKLDYEEVAREPYRNCGNPGSLWPATYTGTITHPSGAVGTFVLDQRRIRRSGLPADNCAYGNLSDPNDDADIYPAAWDSYALTSKSVSGPGLPQATWSYQYQSGSSDTTEVQGPGSFERHTFGNGFRTNEGLPLSIEVGSSSAAITRSTTLTHNTALSGNPYYTRLGDSGQWKSDDFTEEYVRPLTSKILQQDGASFRWTVDVGCHQSMPSAPCLDAYARPIKVTRAMYP